MTQAQDAVVIARAEEQLRQESELFNQKQTQDKSIFLLQKTMGWTAVVLLVAICAFAGFIILNHRSFDAATVTAATAALLVEALASVFAIWRGMLGGGPTELRPTTVAPQLPTVSDAVANTDPAQPGAHP